MASTQSPTTAAAGVDAKAKDDAYFAQRQSTMDSETLDKLLMAEKNLFHAGQATLQAWKLIGRDPDAGGSGGNASANANASAHANGDGEAAPTSPRSAGGASSHRHPLRPHHHHHHHRHHHPHHHSSPPLGRGQHSSRSLGSSDRESESGPSSGSGAATPATAPSASGASRGLDSSGGSSSSMSTSPRLPMEIPRPEGRGSFGQYSSSSTITYDPPLSFSIRSAASTMDALAESNFFAENGRTRSAHANIFGFNRDGPPRSEITLFSFTVRKLDSVLEKLGSKKASIQLQVDIEARTLNFLSPHDARESYSCAAVTARPQSRLGMQLKIQTGTTSLTKKLNFLSSDDRANFMEALEQGKVMCKKSANHHQSYRATEDSFTDEVSVASNDTARMKFRESLTDNFVLLPGESVLENVQRVTNLVVMSQSDGAVQGLLRITTYRITFSPYDSSWKFGSFEVPLATIDYITRDGLILLIACKDLRTIRLAMHDAYTKKKGFDQLPSTPDFRWLNLLTLRMKPPNIIGAVFAFDYYAEKKSRGQCNTSQKEDGWLIYSPVAEYQRLGFLRGADPNHRKQSVDPNVITWRLLKNSKFRFSPTYPQLMVVPSLMSEEQLVQSARFRSRARLPVVVWRHPVNKCVLARSSQPNYGMAGNRSEPDRILLRAYRDSAKRSANGDSPPLHIIDARKPIATKGNRLKGKGVENSQHYDNANIEFMGIANIHKMRESLDALKALVSPNAVDDGDKHYHNRLENTRWLKHVMRVLSGARRVAEVLHEEGASVLVHCSDGWDRTPQMVAIAQLILDPHYRTIRGFAVLVEKEWCSFGHKFADRIGVGKDANDQPNERSPVMLQFLDCVWQMTRQFPTAFEFNEKFLLHVSDALMSGLYGTFLYNSERERIFEKVWERTESVWTPVLENPGPFKNPLYRATNRVIYPRANLKRVVLWDAMYFRWDPESHPDYMEYMDPVGVEEGEAEVPFAQPVADQASQPDFESEEDKALRLEIDVIHDFDELRMQSTLSDCSDMSDDDELDMRISMSAENVSFVEEGTPVATIAAEAEEDGVAIGEVLEEMDDEMLKQYRRGADDRTRQRAQGRNIREAIQMAPEQSRIKYLEQLLNESVARELQLEAELESVYHRLALQRNGASGGA